MCGDQKYTNFLLLGGSSYAELGSGPFRAHREKGDDLIRRRRLVFLYSTKRRPGRGVLFFSKPFL